MCSIIYEVLGRVAIDDQCILAIGTRYTGFIRQINSPTSAQTLKEKRSTDRPRELNADTFLLLHLEQPVPSMTPNLRHPQALVWPGSADRQCGCRLAVRRPSGPPPMDGQRQHTNTARQVVARIDVEYFVHHADPACPARCDVNRVARRVDSRRGLIGI